MILDSMANCSIYTFVPKNISLSLFFIVDMTLDVTKNY